MLKDEEPYIMYVAVELINRDIWKDSVNGKFKMSEKGFETNNKFLT